MGKTTKAEERVRKVFSTFLTASGRVSPSEADYAFEVFKQLILEEKPADKEQWVTHLNLCIASLDVEAPEEVSDEIYSEIETFPGLRAQFVSSLYSSEDASSVESGDFGQAILREDQCWHPVLVTCVLDKQTLKVVFLEYGKEQRTPVEHYRGSDEIVEDEDEELPVEGSCELCQRFLKLTRHHLRPREVHSKYRRMGYSKDELNTCADICRACHNVVHRLADNATLAKKYYSVDLLLQQPSIQTWILYAKKQRVSGLLKQ